MLMDLLLIRPNDQKAIYGEVRNVTACEPPFWAMTIAAYIREKNFKVRILDAESLNLSPEMIAHEVEKENPILVGILVTGTNLSASTWKMEAAHDVIQSIRGIEGQNTNKRYKMFIWGLHPSALPERTMREENIDFLIRGEGLLTIKLLLKALLSGQSYANLIGLYYHDGDKIKGNNDISLLDNLDDLSIQAFDLVPMENYCAHNWQRFGDVEEKGNYAVIATALGCPFNCSFCAVSALFGKKYIRYKSPEKVIEEIDILVSKYHVHYIKILDECFVLNREHVEKICDLLIERKYNLNIWAYARVDTVDEKLLEKLKKAGINWLALGIESANQEVLKGVDKGQYTKEKTKQVVEMIHRMGIHIIANFMFGLPDDTMKSMEITLEFAKELNCEWPNFYTTMAYPGSLLYQNCLKDNVVLPKNWIGYSQYSYECLPLPTKYISAREVLRFRDYAFNNFFDRNERYFSMLGEKFGDKTVNEVKTLLKKKIHRQLLEN